MSEKKQSRYAAKRKRGQMYGPGCCAHALTKEEMNRIRKANGTYGQYGDKTRFTLEDTQT